MKPGSGTGVFTKRGKVGQKRYAGRFFEEFLPELQGRQGIETYKQMSQNDSVIGAILFAVEMLVRQVKFDVEPASDAPKDIDAARFIKQCMNDMSVSWQDALSEMLSFLTYGWSYHEIIYKRRAGPRKGSGSKYSDGLIGWDDFALRAQDSLLRWEYGAGDELLGMVQMAPPEYEERFIPIYKALHLRTKARKANPEGESILRSCYRDYFFKKNLQETEGVGAERGAVGLPMLTPPEGVNIWEDDVDSRALLAQAESLVRNVRRDNVDGVVIPFGWKLELLGGGASKQIDLGAIIERYDRRMAMSVLADFIMLGSTAAGSFALSSDKTELFSLALGTYLDIICDAFNTQAIPRLFDINRRAFGELAECPRLTHGDIEKPDLNMLGGFIEKMAGIGFITPDKRTEKYMRQLAELPERDESGRADARPNAKGGEADVLQNSKNRD